MPETLWQLNEVSVYGSSGMRLANVTVTFASGRTAVLGPSGAGKTTLLNLLVEFTFPDTGRIERTLSDSAGRLPVYWVPQSHGLWPHLSAASHLDSVRRHPSETDLPATDEWLDRFDLLSKRDRLPGSLSQGERARLSVARALAADPRVLIMDEPLACIGGASSDRYWRVVREWCDQRGASLVFSTHIPGLVLSESDRVIGLLEGEVIYSGSVDELYHSPPTPEAACCLGRTNWFESGESEFWLGVPAGEVRSVRPEELALTPAPDGAFHVETSRRRGLFTETDLADSTGTRRRTVYHRPESGLSGGTRVILRRMLPFLILLALIGIWGCRRDRDGRLDPLSIRTCMMPAHQRTIPAPRGIEVGPDGRTFAVDTAGRILVFDRNLELLAHWSMPESEAGNPEDLTLLRNGLIAVPDTHYHRVVIFRDGGAIVRIFGSEGRGPGQFIYPISIAESPDGSLYVCEYGSNDRVQKFTAEGEFLLQFGTFGSAIGQFQRPSGIVWHAGSIYVADAINGRIQAFSESGGLIGVISGAESGGPLCFPYDLAIDKDGAFWVPEWGGGTVAKISTDGVLLGRFGTPGAGERQLSTPWGVAIRESGDILVADTGNRRIVEATWR